MLGDDGEAVVVDPRWDIEVYLELARTEGLRIAHVVDTHDHADHVSGRLRLAQATGARAYRPRAEGEPGDVAGDQIAAGDEIAVGSLRVRAIATPGHRPEHLTFAVVDLARSDEPWMLLTGDSLLVGDIARPDLAYEPPTEPEPCTPASSNWWRWAIMSRSGRPTWAGRCAGEPG